MIRFITPMNVGWILHILNGASQILTVKTILNPYLWWCFSRLNPYFWSLNHTNPTNPHFWWWNPPVLWVPPGLLEGDTKTTTRCPAGAWCNLLMAQRWIICSRWRKVTRSASNASRRVIFLGGLPSSKWTETLPGMGSLAATENIDWIFEESMWL